MTPKFNSFDSFNIGAPFIGLDGKQVSKNKYEYPYSYDCHVTWQTTGFGYGHNFRNEELYFDYSDRLLQYDHNKFNSCSREVWSNEQQIFRHRFPNEIEKFLQLYFSETDLELVVIGEGANVSTGYPYWVFGHRTKK